MINSTIGIKGTHVTLDSSLEMYGDSRALYKVNFPIVVNKFSILNFDLGIVEESERIEVCLYENEDEIERLSFVGDEYRCVDVDDSRSQNKIEIAIGKLFDDRITEINFMGIIQMNARNTRSGESKIDSITIEAGDKTDIFDKEGNCRGLNAYKMINTDDTGIERRQCVCGDDFVSSNGGKILGEYDSCVRCLGCALDGESCVLNRDCLMGTCDGNTCVPGVSQLMIVHMSQHLKISHNIHIFSYC